MLHNNVQPSMTERYNPDCSATSDSRSCGLNGHCGSKLSIAHEFSYEAMAFDVIGCYEPKLEKKDNAGKKEEL